MGLHMFTIIVGPNLLWINGVAIKIPVELLLYLILRI